MLGWFRNLETLNQKRREERLGSSATDLERKYWIALALYAGLAVLAWFTIGEGKVPIFGRMIDLRWIPIFILATLAFRTMVALKADRIRRGK
jgi:bacteriorhodopsin